MFPFCCCSSGDKGSCLLTHFLYQERRDGRDITHDDGDLVVIGLDALDHDVEAYGFHEHVSHAPSAASTSLASAPKKPRLKGVTPEVYA